MKRISTQWAPNYLGRWVMNQDKIWVPAQGEAKQIADMDNKHLLNTLLYLERVAPEIAECCGSAQGLRAPAEWLIERPLYQAMKAELLKRLDTRRPALSSFANAQLLKYENDRLHERLSDLELL